MPEREYAPGEITALGERILEHDVYPTLPTAENGRFIVVDVESGDFEVSDTDVDATESLRRRRPDGAFYGVRVREGTAFHLGFVPGRTE